MHGQEVRKNIINSPLWAVLVKRILVDEDTIIKIILNTYKFAKEYTRKDAPGGKEHIGYIIDRVGFEEYKKWVLDGVELDPETIIHDCVYWNGIKFD